MKWLVVAVLIAVVVGIAMLRARSLSAPQTGTRPRRRDDPRGRNDGGTVGWSGDGGASYGDRRDSDAGHHGGGWDGGSDGGSDGGGGGSDGGGGGGGGD